MKKRAAVLVSFLLAGFLGASGGAPGILP